MRDLVMRYLNHDLSRRSFLKSLAAAGFTMGAAQSVLQSLTPYVHAQDIPKQKIKLFEGTGGELLAEQLMASGVEYVFGNSGTGDSGFYEALVDRPELKYIMVPHEGPLSAMAMGYAKASRKTSYLCVAGMVGMANFMGNLYNAWKDNTSMVFCAYKRESSWTSGRNVHEEVFDQEILAEPFTQWRWVAKRSAMIPEMVRRAFKVAATPPFGPTYISYNHDLLLEHPVKASIIDQSAFNISVHVRPRQKDVERAAKMLIEAQSPVLLVGDEIYKFEAFEKAVKLAELLGLPVTTYRSCFDNFPTDHALFLGDFSPRMRYPGKIDVVLNVGNKIHEGGSRGGEVIPETIKLIDMRLDARHLADTYPAELAMVADPNEGIGDLITAVESMLTPTLKTKIKERFEKTKEYTTKLRESRVQTQLKNPRWNSTPILPQRLGYEVNQVLEKDAIVVSESGSTFSIRFDPLNGKTRIGNIGAHLGKGVGTAAGVKLAKPNNQTVLLVGDGSFVFGPQGLWTMARYDIPVLTVIYNNYSYNGVKDRSIELGATAKGRMRDTGKVPHDWLGDPKMQLAKVAEGFGVKAEFVQDPKDIQPALKRGVNATRDGKPYVVEVAVARSGAIADNPWHQRISLASERTKKV
ncbi:MAG: thiamine pyrophosphate-binding protein [Candidatus Binatia bacterium]